MPRLVRHGLLCGAMIVAAAPILPMPQALAQCAPLSGAATPGTTVTCSGSTNNQDNPNGYGTGAQSVLTINVAPAASVTGTQNGFFLNDANTVNNFGTITGLGSGISAAGISRLFPTEHWRRSPNRLRQQRQRNQFRQHFRGHLRRPGISARTP